MDEPLSGSEEAMMREPPGRPDVLRRIQTLLVESLQLNLPEHELRGVTRLSEIAGVDSMAAVVFVAAVEKEFDMVIEPELLRLDFIEDLPRLAAYVEARHRV
ncbi:MAG TPA: phosphopantetheine-binding protein [Bryobacteraceae bacterium]|nr:phosphopantetheine-binding protein [Bryobacteraceae bacterium]